MIRIVTDSTADLTDSMIAEYHIETVPLNIIIDVQTYADGDELSKQEFYERMKSSRELPSTSQASPSLFKQRFQAILDRGDEVFYIGLSSTLSGTLQSALIGRDMLDEPHRVTIFDSLTVSYGQGMLAVEAAKMAREGRTPDEITARLTELRKRQRLVFSVSTLENLRKSGRINNLSFLFGSLLNIKPILNYGNDGVVQVYDRVRGKKNAHLAVARFLNEHPADPSMPIGLGHTCNPESAAELIAVLEENGITNTFTFELSGVIGAHVGPGTVGIIYLGK
jgi:DegV family protein with EDD domain